MNLQRWISAHHQIISRNCSGGVPVSEDVTRHTGCLLGTGRRSPLVMWLEGQHLLRHFITLLLLGDIWTNELGYHCLGKDKSCLSAGAY